MMMVIADLALAAQAAELALDDILRLNWILILI
jgi:hypothetical protein